jgi:hypothetical protein
VASNLIIDTCIVHDFHSSTADIAQHGGLRYQDPNRVLNDTAVKKIEGNGYHQDYLQNNKGFLPLIMSTSGHLHGEFVRLLYLLAHWHALTFFTSLGYEPCYEELCQRRGAFFFQHHALIGLAGAQAVSLRMGGNTPSFANNACQHQALSHVSSLDDAAGFHWLDVDNLFADLPQASQQAFLWGLSCLDFMFMFVFMCLYGLVNLSMDLICFASFFCLLSSQSVNKPPHIWIENVFGVEWLKLDWGGREWHEWHGRRIAALFASHGRRAAQPDCKRKKTAAAALPASCQQCRHSSVWLPGGKLEVSANSCTRNDSAGQVPILQCVVKWLRQLHWVGSRKQTLFLWRTVKHAKILPAVKVRVASWIEYALHPCRPARQHLWGMSHSTVWRQEALTRPFLLTIGWFRDAEELAQGVVRELVIKRPCL